MVVVAVGVCTVSRLRGVLGSYVSVPESGTADLIIEFEPKRVICEVLVTGALLIGWRKVFR
jgi:hypothetical protein